LDHSTSVAIFRKLKNTFLDDLKESLLVRLFSVLKQFLEDVVSKLVFGQFNALLDKRLEDCVLGI
jgi:hypothetical protein